MVGSRINADVLHFGPNFQGGGCSFDLEILGELNCVAALEFVSVGVSQDSRFCLGSGFFCRPFVPAIGAGEKWSDLVGVFGLAFGTIWRLVHKEWSSPSAGKGKGVCCKLFKLTPRGSFEEVRP